MRIEVGDLCKVVRNGHKKPQIDNVIVVTRFVGAVYVEGVNTLTGNRHHYLRDNLIKL
jgi:ribosomal protein L24